MNLRIEQDGRLRRIALAAPEKRNLLDAAMCQDLLRELRDAVADDTVGAILLEADGPIFCAASIRWRARSCSRSAAEWRSRWWRR